jgi:AraC-like DNA-binding protein/flagellar basal body-associated protein FliL
LRSKSLLIKMIIFGSILSILPVVFVGSFSYIQSSKQVQKQVNHAELQFIRQVNSNIEQILMTVDHTLTNLLESTVMESALYNPLDASNFQLYNNLRSEIIHLQSFDTKVEDLIILNRQQDWLFKNSGIKRLSQHSDREKYVSYFNLEHSSSWLLLAAEEFSDSITSQSCPYIISLIKKLPSIRTEKYGLAFANIPACSIADMINSGQEAEEVMVINEAHQIVVHRDTSMLGTFLSEHPVFNSEVAFTEPSGQIHLSYNNRPFTVTYHKSSFNNWIYLSVISINELTKESRQIGWFTFIISLSIISLSFFFVWLTTRRLYLPVNKLVRLIKGNDSQHSTDPKSEVQVIEDHIRQLFSSKSKLELEVKDHTQQIRTLFLNRLFSGNLRQAEIDEKIMYFGFDQQTRHWKNMTVLTLQVDTLDNTRYESKDLELLLFAISNIVEEKITKEQRFPTVLFDRTLVILIGFAEEDVELVNDNIYKLTESLKSLIEQYLNLSVSIGISLLFQNINQAFMAYDEGLEALKHRIKLGKGVIIPYSSMSLGNPSVIYEYPVRVEHDLMDAIKMSEQEETLGFLHTWMEEVIHKMQSPSEYQISVMCLLNRLLVLKQEAGISFQQIDVHKASLYEELLLLQMGEEIEEWFKKRLILPLLKVFRDRRDSQYHNLSEKIIDMIQNHYDVDFTLEDCAAKLHYNANYLSSVFKKETQFTFSEYLANYRLQMAKQWLTDTDMAVKEIADRLKYTNSHNFIRSFRKQEDMTPGEYRSKYTRK